MGRLKVKPGKARKPRRFVHIGELPEGATFAPHPMGGIIVIAPDHEPVWWRVDGTKVTVKIVD
jgi:hypothetical protein